MLNVSIIGVGRTAVAEHWDKSLRDLAFEAVQAALADANLDPDDLDMLIIGNTLSALTTQQGHLGALLAEYVGLRGIEAHTVEGADAAGGLALRQGILAIKSGLARHVLVLGAEKMTDSIGAIRNSALATMLDADYEAAQGATPIALAALMMRRYMHEHAVSLANFEHFSITAHANGSKNPHAMYRNLIKPGRFAAAPMVADPINLFDGAPEGDGAAAVILSSSERAADLVPKPVRILGSGAATDSLAITDRADILYLQAVNSAAGRAFAQADKLPSEVDVLELHDSYTILSTLQLEAAGFAPRGKGWQVAAEHHLPMSTFGGLKARGHALGATGVYQAVEIALQLRGEAGNNQVDTAQLGMAINVGGLGGTAVAHLFGL